jgi:outer membrane lipoprotein carrier protein
MKPATGHGLQAPPRRSRRRALALGLLAAAPASWVWMAAADAAEPDAVARLERFVAEVKSGRAQFEQTVTTPDGARRKASGGSLEFVRPGRFRFDYRKPYPQQLIGDGQTVWSYDPELQQATRRRMDQALGATPAALLTGGDLNRSFTLSAEPDADGLAWAKAVPKTDDGPFQWMRVGFRSSLPERVEILDRFGQRTVMQLSQFEAGVALDDERFRFTPPPGTDVLAQ